MDELLKDARFAHVAKDPKFRHIPKAERKVKIDKRFQGMFKDKKFVVTYTTDKRGRPVNQSTTENLRKYYDLPSSEEEEEEKEEEEGELNEDTSVSSASKETKTKESTKNIENKKIKNKKKKKETAKETDSNSVKDSVNTKNKEGRSDDDCSPSNENLIQIKSKKEDNSDDGSDKSSNDTEDESVEERLSQVDLDENEKQLHKRRKNENSKLTSEVKKRLKDLSVNYARGEGVLLTDSSSEEESSEASDDEEIEHDWGELDKDAETTDKITHKLAICNMNWDVIRAVDLMILLNSFLPSGGFLRSVTIYPSEYGQQRMKEEEISGPKELKDDNINSDDENEDNEEGAQYHMEKLRQYQLNRLKYYYAVAEFDSAETANKVYTECDGIEYESTSNRLDLRFIPDDMTFDQEPKDTCNEIPTKYQPRQFTTTALQQVKVDLTWDDVDPDRQEFLQKANSGKLEDIDESDLHKYLASGSEESDTEEKKNESNVADGDLDSKVKNDPIEKYKALLRSIEEEEEKTKNKDVELEVTWDVGAKEKVEELVKEKMKNNEELTPFEQYLEKRKAKKKAKREERKQKEKSQKDDSEDSIPSDVNLNDEYFAEELKTGKSLSRKKKKKDEEKNVSNDEEEDRRKAELELLLMDQDEDGAKKHFNMKEIEENTSLSKSKRKRLSKKKAQEETKEDNFEVDVKDPRFTALFTSHHFNIDPTDPHYRKTKGTEVLVNEKLKRRADDAARVEDMSETQSKKSRINEKLSMELQALVKSVKRKTQNIMQPIKR
ncbi:ESF1 homolog [Harpegnathos saltator]|uniref:ESF1-like protein n=1 Tax=Harpegnathos saltator TaxID=610380 RepID=E2BW94_HARSA|nr:ESF1 homolog [Harpegnathos saltator]EFN79998.1 ESF1-like protein [Harpegnathos saltator]